MIEQYANANCLSCLLNSQKDLEFLPEPFRMQSNVTFRVTPSTYTEFVLALTPYSNVKLMTHLDILQKLASVGSPKLYNCFLADMAFAILKEISYAEVFNSTATLILPTSQKANIMPVSKLTAIYDGLPVGVTVELRELVECSGFFLPAVIGATNVDLYKTAVVLYYLSKRSMAVKEVTVLYDCSR